MSPHSGNNPSQMWAALIMFPIRQACLFGECVGYINDLDVASSFFFFFPDQCAGMFLQQILVFPCFSSRSEALASFPLVPPAKRL